jgi:hypothetical protein
MSASGQKRKARNEPMMSAFHPIATQQRTQFYVGFVPLAEVGSTGRTGYLIVFPVLPCVSLRQVGMLLRAEPGWTCPDMEVEICGRYGKSPVESDLGIIGAAKLAECFKFQNQDNRKLKFGQIARRWISALPENK